MRRASRRTGREGSRASGGCVDAYLQGPPGSLRQSPSDQAEGVRQRYDQATDLPGRWLVTVPRGVATARCGGRPVPRGLVPTPGRTVGPRRAPHPGRLAGSHGPVQTRRTRMGPSVLVRFPGTVCGGFRPHNTRTGAHRVQRARASSLPLHRQFDLKREFNNGLELSFEFCVEFGIVLGSPKGGGDRVGLRAGGIVPSVDVADH